MRRDRLVSQWGGSLSLLRPSRWSLRSKTELPWSISEARQLLRFNPADRAFFFDHEFYTRTNPDVPRSEPEAFQHFVQFGFAEGRVPVDWFDEDEYCSRYADVVAAGIGAFPHFYLYGFFEGRDPSESLRIEDLASELAVQRGFRSSAYWHAFEEAVKEVHASEPVLDVLTTFFDESAYCSDHLVVPELQLSPLQHALMFGQRDYRLLKYVTMPANSYLRGEGPVDVSVVILNWNRNDMTVAALLSLATHTAGHTFEIIVVDNGSELGDFETVARFNHQVRVLRLSQNMFYGEGNNIGVEAARGEIVVLLNNDAMVQPDWLGPLVQQLNDEGVCSAGPAFYYPNGKLQEAGCFLQEDGNAQLVGRDIEATDEWMSGPQTVDYTSGACLALRRAEFLGLGGFNFVYEPAYYEDSDLSLRLSYELGKRCVFEPSSKVTHLEHASSDVPIDLGLSNAVERNRTVFLSRWTKKPTGTGSQWSPIHRPVLPDRCDSVIAAEVKERPTLHILTPFALTFGGGERYILTLAQYASEVYDVVLVTTMPYSNTRLVHLGNELELDLSSIRLAHFEDVVCAKPDVLVAMDNHVLPRFPGYGKRNIYHCQFPFPSGSGQLAHTWANHKDFDTYVVNSQFTREHVLAALERIGLSKPVTVAYPPVADRHDPALEPDGSKILSVGRIFSSGHAKNFDDLIRVFSSLSSYQPEISLTLIGGLPVTKESQELYRDLRRATERLKIQLLPNATNRQVQEELNRSAYYWHGTGLGVNTKRSPEACEHFGITPVEALTAGATVLAVANGGPPEYLRHGETGYLYRDAEELESTMRQLLRGDLGRTGDRGRQEALRFSPENFWASWAEVLGSD